MKYFFIIKILLYTNLELVHSQVITKNVYCNYESAILLKIENSLNFTDSLEITNEATVLKFEAQLFEFLALLKSKRKLKNYGRQYFTYIKNKRKYLFVNFVNLSDKELKRIYLEDFQKNLIIGFGEKFEKNTFSIIFDLYDFSFRLQ